VSLRHSLAGHDRWVTQPPRGYRDRAHPASTPCTWQRSPALLIVAHHPSPTTACNRCHAPLLSWRRSQCPSAPLTMPLFRYTLHVVLLLQRVHHLVLTDSLPPTPHNTSANRHLLKRTHQDHRNHTNHAAILPAANRGPKREISTAAPVLRSKRQ
jgi:hypothetical protein